MSCLCSPPLATLTALISTLFRKGEGNKRRGRKGEGKGREKEGRGRKGRAAIGRGVFEALKREERKGEY